MEHLMQRIDTDWKAFFIALLVIVLLMVLFWVVSLKITIWKNKREHERAEAKRDNDCLAKIYQDVDIPAYMRNERFEARDRKPWVK